VTTKAITWLIGKLVVNKTSNLHCSFTLSCLAESANLSNAHSPRAVYSFPRSYQGPEVVEVQPPPTLFLPNFEARSYLSNNIRYLPERLGSSIPRGDNGGGGLWTAEEAQNHFNL